MIKYEGERYRATTYQRKFETIPGFIGPNFRLKLGSMAQASIDEGSKSFHTKEQRYLIFYQISIPPYFTGLGHGIIDWLKPIEMVKATKRSIKYLRQQKGKNTESAENGTKKKRKIASKKNRKDEMISEDIDVERVIPLSDPSMEGASKPSGIIKKHQNELMNLQEKDPEFYDFLKQNDASLLDFGNDESDEDDVEMDEENNQLDLNNSDADDNDDDNVYDNGSGLKETKEKTNIDVTQPILDALMKQANDGSLSALKKLCSILRSACVPAGDTEDTESPQHSNRYVISSAEAYEYTMTHILENLHISFYKHLNLPSKPNQNQIKNIETNEKWKRMQLLVLSFFKSILHTLSTLSDNNSSQGQVTVFLLTALEPYIILLSPMTRLARATLKVFLSLWSHHLSPTEDTENMRGYAFLRIRHMAVTLPGTIAEECFRSLYLTYARTCKTFTEITGPSVLFMAQSITELYLTDVALAYQHGFLYIRQLALHLRSAIIKKDADAIRQISSWQYLNCIRLWTRILCALPEDDALGPLLFPLVQIINGVMAALPSFYYIPLKFHLITCLQQLAAYGQVFIPTVAKILEVIEAQELTSKPTASTEIPPKLQYLVKLPTDSATKPPVRDIIIQETITLIRQDAELYRYHVSLPEYTYLTIKKLKIFSKKSKIARWRDLSRALASQLEQQSAIVKKDRVKLGKTPMEITAFEPLLPSHGVNKAAGRLKTLMSDRGLNSVSDVLIKSVNTSNSFKKDKDNNEDNDVTTATNKKSQQKEKTNVKSKKDTKTKAVVNTSQNTNIDDLHDEVKQFTWSDEEEDEDEEEEEDNEMDDTMDDENDDDEDED
eukprot:gene2293-4460_t